MLLILAGVSINAVFSERGIFDRAEKATNKYSEAKAKEVLETVLMADAQTEKYTNPKYNQDEFLDELIKKEIPGTDIKGDVVIIDGWAFELDRSVPKIGKDLGQADKLVFPTVTVSEAQLASDSRTATFTVTALEETNGINKIEIWLNGEKLETFDKTYSNVKTELREDFTVNRNGLYTVKVYGKLMISKTVEVEGIVPAVKFSPNGSTEWKMEHSSKITIEQTGETVTEIKYLWKTGENEPQASEFTETCTDNSIITGKELTGKYHLWVLLKTDNDKTNICGSEEFWFDNQGPNITAFTSTKYSVDGITLSATAQDTGLGTIRFEFYVDDELKDTQTCEATTESITKTSISITGLTTGSHNCKVIVYDLEGNQQTKTITGTTMLYSWKCYYYNVTYSYYLGDWTLMEHKTGGNSDNYKIASRPGFTVSQNGSIAFSGNEIQTEQRSLKKGDEIDHYVNNQSTDKTKRYASKGVVTKPCEKYLGDLGNGNTYWGWTCYEYDVYRAYLVEDRKGTIGSFKEVVTNKDRSYFPDKGEKNGYWYEWNGII